MSVLRIINAEYVSDKSGDRFCTKEPCHLDKWFRSYAGTPRHTCVLPVYDVLVDSETE
jgi:hypothetical protein